MAPAAPHPRMRRCPPARVRDPLLRALVPGAGSVRQAANELRWLRQELPAAKLVRACTLRGKYGYPLQYLLGSQPFGPLDIKCRRGVLIPRWETEEWVTKLSADVSPTARVLDMCTGTGCALFLLAHFRNGVTGWGADVSAKALRLFDANRAALGLEARTEALHHDVFEPLPQPCRSADIVIANPPYIAALRDADYAVSCFEPRLALLEQPGIYSALIERVLETRASLAVFEVGTKQQIDHCVAEFARFGWSAHGEKDSAGNWRTVWARRTLLQENVGVKGE